VSAKGYYIIAALLLLATIPVYMKIYAYSKAGRDVPPLASAQKEAGSLTSVRPRAYGWTDVDELATKGFNPAKPLPSGYECSSADGYVVQVKKSWGKEMIEPLMDNGQMLRCSHGLYGGNAR